MNMVILGAKITMPTHKPKVYWKLRSSAHQEDTPGCETTKAPHQPASKKCVSYFAQQKMRISFCDVDVTFLHSKITTSCKILISHLLHCKTSLVFGDVGLMSHFCVTFVVQNLWGYLGQLCLESMNIPMKDEIAIVKPSERMSNARHFRDVHMLD